jgi:hypothetical protein
MCTTGCEENDVATIDKSNLSSQFSKIENKFSQLFNGINIKEFLNKKAASNEFSKTKNNALNIFEEQKKEAINFADKNFDNATTKGLQAFEHKKNMDIQFANSFITNIINLVKNNEAIINEGDIADINNTGAAFINLIFTIAEKEKKFTTTGVIQHKKEIIDELLQQSNKMKKIVLKAKIKFESQGNTTLNSEELFSFN